jgi:iron complex outermembrane receptor protein
LPDIIAGNDTITRSDIIRKRMVNEYDVFWLPEFSLNHILGELIIAGNVRYHFANHKGDVIWAEHYPDNIGPDWTYYNYNVTKDHYKLVLSEKTKIGNKFILLTAVEVEYLKYHYFADSMKTNVDFNVPAVFVNPKAGVNYNINKFMGLYFSFGMASRMPGLDNYYDADHPYWSYPIFKDTINFTDPYIKPERLNDYEFGVNIVYGQHIESKINLYYMDFKNELVYSGQLDDNGVPIVGNAKKSFHSGIEIANRINISKHLDITLNGSYNYNKLIDYIGYTMDWNTYTADSIDLSGNLAGGFPICLFFGSVRYNINNFSIEIMDRLVGKQYIDNTMDENTAIRPYNIVNANLSYMYKCFELSANVNNIFNTLTATNGYMDEGTAYYFPNAIRNYNVKLRICF